MELPDWINVLYDLLLFTGMALVYISEALILTLIPRRYRAKSIKGEVALVTGGAGGIGRLIAMKLAKLGAHVVIWDINRTGLEDTVQEIRRSGGKCWSYYCDITNRNEVYRIAKTVQIEVGPVTLLINNAGYVYGKTLMDLPDDEIERTYNVNILSHYWITKAFMRDMMKNNHGHIVTVASVAGLLGTYNCTDYSATKFAAIGYHESLFTELKAHGYDGIHATLVCPYFINTGMFHGVKPRLMPMLEPDYVAEEVVSGILVNQINVVLPGSVRYLLPLKCLLPAKLCWALMYHVIKGPQSMMMLKGREEKILKNNNNIFDAVISKETHVR
ncbi:estradiol 17-beta-dehydrogenase 11 [Megachile rotundata]|uniref:estradiol 17-beta-dehydrogenase 11 n=1 Tax=Megachile rotundata TaxID=143995 RepID=UPI000258F3E0|nr:PREDICTED: estradiol 17-beta-dehydrogenase 11-like isoform X3 [Megachile rotundata]XP_012150957.1 PREDICTED: estradiol 17-beta-dehydrogenase 11-like isoform X3 [Megachile rotundata]XP_012150958.1 PREDICTED: estradiol 17-beta-dehydrogenase 11-like isoform X3 [Megachile rotundata]XP_012150959.1 PREDICTED: estradiol 17-beta-dehydrogenase 11-like isoform X3 [Megachile rotundata]